jgi:hypothetical protein
LIPSHELNNTSRWYFHFYYLGPQCELGIKYTEITCYSTKSIASICCLVRSRWLSRIHFHDQKCVRCFFRDLLIKLLVRFTASTTPSRTLRHFVIIDPEMEIPVNQILMINYNMSSKDCRMHDLDGMLRVVVDAEVY